MPTWAINLIGALIIAAVIFGCGMKLMSSLDAGTIAKYQKESAAQTAAVKQVTAVTNLLTKDDQAKEVLLQGAIAGQTQVVTKEITRYVASKAPPPVVPAAVPCITVGELRVHDAAVLGVDPSTVVPPAGEPDDACSTVAPSDFMAGVVANYGAARANAQQLDDLEGDVAARAAAAQAVGPPTPLVAPLVAAP